MILPEGRSTVAEMPLLPTMVLVATSTPIYPLSRSCEVFSDNRDNGPVGLPTNLELRYMVRKHRQTNRPLQQAVLA
jgi:hypothetical protein